MKLIKTIYRLDYDVWDDDEYFKEVACFIDDGNGGIHGKVESFLKNMPPVVFYHAGYEGKIYPIFYISKKEAR